MWGVMTHHLPFIFIMYDTASKDTQYIVLNNQDFVEIFPTS